MWIEIKKGCEMPDMLESNGKLHSEELLVWNGSYRDIAECWHNGVWVDRLGDVIVVKSYQPLPAPPETEARK